MSINNTIREKREMKTISSLLDITDNNVKFSNFSIKTIVNAVVTEVASNINSTSGKITHWRC